MTRRRRFCPPPPRRRPSWCAIVAEQSAELGSIAAVFEQRDRARDAKVAVAAARSLEVDQAITLIRWRAADLERYRRWLTRPLELPAWADGEGWPEP